MGATMEISLPPMHPAQKEVFDGMARFTVLLAGRRWGKTLFGVGMGFYYALQGGRVWWVAPTYALAKTGWRSAKHLAEQVPGSNVNNSERSIILPGGGEIQIRTGKDPVLLRSEGLDFAVLDEAAYMQEAVWVDSIRPALTDRKGRALFISTAFGNNWFSKLYKYAYKYARAHGGGEWGAFRY
ncbi:hypothetical protein LCGC14_2261010, partial [marine sediment metagenome]